MSSDIDKRNGEIIEEFRLSLGMKKCEFAKMLGYSTESISKYRKGVKSLPKKLYAKLVDTYNLPLEKPAFKKPKRVKVANGTVKSSNISLQSANSKINFENGIKLQKFVEDNDLTMIELQDILKRSHSTVKHYLNGEYTLRKEQIDLLNTEYGLDLEYPQYNNYRKRLRVSKIESVSGLHSFGYRLCKIRKDSGMTLKEFASKYNMSYSHLYKLESGSAITLRIDTIARLKEDGIDVYDLIGITK